uniref:Reverse transcriptase domain-containing protein n=1 Tax=Globodera pallida TaxID=36090 RepID=A0A183C946_GLOPA
MQGTTPQFAPTAPAGNFQTLTPTGLNRDQGTKILEGAKALCTTGDEQSNAGQTPIYVRGKCNSKDRTVAIAQGMRNFQSKWETKVPERRECKSATKAKPNMEPEQISSSKNHSWNKTFALPIIIMIKLLARLASATATAIPVRELYIPNALEHTEVWACRKVKSGPENSQHSQCRRMAEHKTCDLGTLAEQDELWCTRHEIDLTSRFWLIGYTSVDRFKSRVVANTWLSEDAQYGLHFKDKVPKARSCDKLLELSKQGFATCVVTSKRIRSRRDHGAGEGLGLESRDTGTISTELRTINKPARKRHRPASIAHGGTEALAIAHALITAFSLVPLSNAATVPPHILEQNPETESVTALLIAVVITFVVAMVSTLRLNRQISALGKKKGAIFFFEYLTEAQSAQSTGADPTDDPVRIHAGMHMALANELRQSEEGPWLEEQRNQGPLRGRTRQYNHNGGPQSTKPRRTIFRFREEKKDGGLRPCIDFRKLNEVTVPDHFPLPRLEVVLEKVGNCHWYTSRDQSAGVLQVRLTERAVRKQSFVRLKQYDLKLRARRMLDREERGCRKTRRAKLSLSCFSVNMTTPRGADGNSDTVDLKLEQKSDHEATAFIKSSNTWRRTGRRECDHGVNLQDVYNSKAICISTDQQDSNKHLGIVNGDLGGQITIMHALALFGQVQVTAQKVKVIVGVVVENSATTGSPKLRVVSYVSFKPAQPNRLVMDVRNIDVSVNGDLGGQITIMHALALFGQVQVTAQKVKVIVGVVVENSATTGSPKLRVVSCTGRVGNVQTSIQSGGLLGDIANQQLKHKINKIVQRQVTSQLCKRVPQMVEEQVNPQISGVVPKKIAFKSIAQVALNSSCLAALTESGGTTTTKATTTLTTTTESSSSNGTTLSASETATTKAPGKKAPSPISLIMQLMDMKKLDNLFLNSQLLGSAATSNDYTIKLRGDFSVCGWGCTPFSPFPAQIPACIGKNCKMADIMLSDYTINTMLYHMHRVGFFVVKIGPDTPAVGRLMRLTCESGDDDEISLDDHGVEDENGTLIVKRSPISRRTKRQDEDEDLVQTLIDTGICIRSLLPAAADEYPDEKVDLVMRTMRAPSATIYENGTIILEQIAKLEFFGHTNKKKVGFFVVKIGPDTPAVGRLMRLTCESGDDDEVSLDDHGVEDENGTLIVKRSPISRRTKRQDEDEDLVQTLIDTGICIRSLLPAAADEYPDEKVDLVMRTMRAPSATIYENGTIILEQIAKLEFFGHTNKKKLGTFKSTSTAQIDVNSEGEIIKANLTLPSLTLTDIGTDVKSGMTQEGLDTLTSLMKEKVPESANKKLAKGCKLDFPPGVGGLPIRVLNPEVHFVPRAVHIKSNFELYSADGSSPLGASEPCE